MIRHRVLYLSALLLATSAAPGTAQTPEEFTALLRKGQARLAAAEAAYGGYRCQHDATVPSPPKAASGKPTVKHSSSVVVRRGGRLLLEFEDMPAGANDTPRKRVKMCLTNDYLFAISGLSTNPAWSLVQFTRSDRETTFRDNLTTQTPIVFPLRAVTQKWTLDDVIDLPTFSIRTVRPRPDGLIDAEFSVVKNLSPDRPATLEGTLTVSPRHEYAVTECKFTLSLVKMYQSQMTRVLSEPGEPLRCSQLRYQSINTTTGAVDFKDEYRFSDYTTDEPDKARFTLEHYGIPTPTDGLPSVYSGWKFWALVAAAGLGLALVFRWLARRRNPPS